jgi:hypothetical protein
MHFDKENAIEGPEGAGVIFQISHLATNAINDLIR